MRSATIWSRSPTSSGAFARSISLLASSWARSRITNSKRRSRQQPRISTRCYTRPGWAALQMRDRAAEEAGDLRSGVETSAAATRASADADGYALRKSAWDTCTEMLEQVKQEVARLRKQSDRDSLAIVGEAERDAHKKIATARRDAESEVRSARHDAERIMVEARGERDEMMEHAARATESAQERTRALERRREVLMTELEDLRLEREAPPDPPGRGVTEAVRLIPSGDATSGAPTPFMDPKGEWDDDDARIVSAPLQHAPWADGKGVRGGHDLAGRRSRSSRFLGVGTVGCVLGCGSHLGHVSHQEEHMFVSPSSGGFIHQRCDGCRRLR